jgi:putative transposase
MAPEGLKVPSKQPKRGRLWLNGSLYIRLRPEYPNHVWSYDLVEDRTHNGRKIRMLNVIDEFTRECIAIKVERKLKAVDVLSDLFIMRGVPAHKCVRLNWVLLELIDQVLSRGKRAISPSQNI